MLFIFNTAKRLPCAHAAFLCERSMKMHIGEAYWTETKEPEHWQNVTDTES